MSENYYVHLPNKLNKWQWGMSLALYSRPYRETNGVQVNTPQGHMIHSYKYIEVLTQEQRENIANDFAKQVFKLILNQLKKEFPDPNKPPFDVVLGIPENRNSGKSLPKDLCKILARDHPWIKDGFSCVKKTRSGQVIKGTPREQRPEKVAGLYEIDENHPIKPIYGFLIIDDVFETGSTVREFCDTLQKVFPRIPRFVIALTHLHSTENLEL